MFAYVTLGGIESYLPQVDSQPSPTWYPVAYAVRVAVVAALAWWYRQTWKDFRPGPGLFGLALAVLTGLLVTVLWVGLEGHYPGLPFLGKRVCVRSDADVARGTAGLLRGQDGRTGGARPLDRGAVLEVVPDPMADRPGLPSGADRAESRSSRRA